MVISLNVFWNKVVLIGVLSLVYLIGGVLAVRNVISRTVRWSRNAALFGQLSRTLKNLDGPSLERTLSQFTDDAYRTRLIRLVRHRELLEPSESALSTLRKLVSSAEEASDPSEMQGSYVDELFLLIEQILQKTGIRD